MKKKKIYSILQLSTKDKDLFTCDTIILYHWDLEKNL